MATFAKIDRIRAEKKGPIRYIAVVLLLVVPIMKNVAGPPERDEQMEGRARAYFTRKVETIRKRIFRRKCIIF